ncbi:VOC family protein [Microvirga flavescens]|uniref:VOC family protein n=1 Tax=Microvirga flavescens TaxID=2249811 RepID=UPI000DD905D7|nr:VOC family protein [Microvirga flavescens]
MPKLQAVLETALYVDDLARAKTFYETVLELRVLRADSRFCAFDVNGRNVLLLFKRGGSAKAMPMPGGVIPPHDGAGPLHMAFAISAQDLSAWEAALAKYGIAIESRVTWPRGGTSLYFRDPDGHAIELATPGLWEIY